MLLPVIASFMARYKTQATVLSLILLASFIVYNKGRFDCAERHRKAAAKVEAEWQAKVADAAQDAYERGIAAAYADTRNEEIVNEIEEAAAAEAGADDVCLSADVVERLRSIQ